MYISSPIGNTVLFYCYAWLAKKEKRRYIFWMGLIGGGNGDANRSGVPYYCSNNDKRNIYVGTYIAKALTKSHWNRTIRSERKEQRPTNRAIERHPLNVLSLLSESLMATDIIVNKRNFSNSCSQAIATIRANIPHIISHMYRWMFSLW